MADIPSFLNDLRLEKRSVIILTSSVILLTLAWYPGYYTTFLKILKDSSLGNDPRLLWYAHGLQFAADMILMLTIPLFIIKFALKEDLKDFGLCLGDWRFALKYLAVALVVLTPILYIGSKDPGMLQEYPLVRGFYDGTPSRIIMWEATYLIYYISWEFHFRGFQQLGMERRIGAVGSILIQMLSSTLIHVRKPFGETMAAILGAWLMGILVFRSRSIIWAVILHWYIGAATDYFCFLHGIAPMN